MKTWLVKWLVMTLKDYKMKNKLTKEQKKELEKLAAEMEAVAIQMKLDYETNPSEMSGSVVVFHENSELLKEEDNG